MDLKMYLESRNIENKEFADMVGISPGAVSNYKNGIRTPTLAIAIKIKDVTKGKVSIHDLLLKKEDEIIDES